MADFDFEEEDPYFDEEDDIEFDPRDDWGYKLYDNYDVVNRNRPDVPFESEYTNFMLQIKLMHFINHKKNDFGMLTDLHDINSLALYFFFLRSKALCENRKKSRWERRC